MKKIALLAAGSLSCLLVTSHAAASGTACYDWSCDSGTGQCTINAICSTASPYIWKYDIDFGDGNSTGLTGTATWNHSYASNVYDARVKVTIYYFSEPSSSSITCDINTRLLPVGPQLPPSAFYGHCD